ncbi:helix-turn-helix domain-containing protein [Synechococcus sp. PCC 7335]|uniref:helix-turn-helix domain-containing protein n=1 Tax=Synechococcus sp. (strain ATCC 29403 / PCC 7335) TaxID=91464 RepID=UPI0002E403D6|nr:helix-turn-helix domain-containing protein [Synechococcus sp. PCC 7335]
MGRKLQIKSHYSVDELKARYRASFDPVEARRWQLIWLVSEGKTLTAAAEVIADNYHYAREIVSNYNAAGAEGLRNRRKDSRPNSMQGVLTIEQCEALDERLQAPQLTVAFGVAQKWRKSSLR